MQTRRRRSVSTTAAFPAGRLCKWDPCDAAAKLRDATRRDSRRRRCGKPDWVSAAAWHVRRHILVVAPGTAAFGAPRQYGGNTLAASPRVTRARQAAVPGADTRGLRVAMPSRRDSAKARNSLCQPRFPTALLAGMRLRRNRVSNLSRRVAEPHAGLAAAMQSRLPPRVHPEMVDPMQRDVSSVSIINQVRVGHGA